MKVDPALVDQMAAGDEAAFLVFADQLQEAGHPLGEILALERRGDAARAAALIEEQRAALVGSLRPSLLKLTGGFLELASVKSRAQLDALVALPSSVLLKELRILVNGDRELLAVASRELRHLYKLFLWLPATFESLVMPRLVRLTLWVDDPKLGARLDPVLAARGLEGLRELEILGDRRKSGPIPIALLEDLIASPLVAQLERLSISQGNLLTPEHAAVLAREAAARLAGLKQIYLDNVTPAFEAAFGDRLKSWPHG
jgi:hypothetical protein